MGYFNERRKKREAKAINILDQKRYQYESNMRESIEQLIQDGNASKLTDEIAEVIKKQAEVYSYRIAKSKRTELAQDILVVLSVKK